LAVFPLTTPAFCPLMLHSLMPWQRLISCLWNISVSQNFIKTTAS